MIDTLRNNFPISTQGFMTLEDLYPVAEAHRPIPVFERELESELKIIKSHMDTTLVTAPYEPDRKIQDFTQELLNRSKVIYVYRDGRDVLTSLYYYVSKISGPRDCFYEFLKEVPKTFDGNRVEYWVHHVTGWIGCGSIFLVSFEDLLQAPENIVQRVGAWLGFPVPTDIANMDMNAAVSTGREVTRSSVLPRKGTAGDHKSHFDERCRILFDDAASELMKRLGYNR